MEKKLWKGKKNMVSQGKKYKKKEARLGGLLRVEDWKKNKKGRGCRKVWEKVDINGGNGWVICCEQKIEKKMGLKR